MSDFSNAPELLPDNEKNSHILHRYARMDNIADVLSEEKLNELGMRVIQGFDKDLETQRQWLKSVDEAQKLAKLTKEPKNTPLPNSANIKHPLITQACYQFAARTYPELVHDNKVVKCEIIGQADQVLEDTADRISTHMSYQLLGIDTKWEAGMDKLLVLYSNVGFVCKKTYYDPLLKRNMSVVCNYKDLVLRNAVEINEIDDLRRITHILRLHPNDLIEMAREGAYSETEVDFIINLYKADIIDPVIEFYEQHRFADLDDDGYEEPYIVTTHKDTGKVIRVKARYERKDIKLDGKKVVSINPIQYFTAYHFLPSPDGCFMSMGFGTLMLDLNDTVNTILNQITDSGSLANMQTGFIDSRLKVMGGQTLMDPGQWNRVKGVIGQTLKDGIVPIVYKEPSTVLFQLLGLLIQATKDLSASTDIMQGAEQVQNVAATSMMAMVEQGMKMFSAIQKRLYRSLRDEYQKLYRLNQTHFDAMEYNALVGGQKAISYDDYQSNSIRVIPIADPNLSSDAQRLAQAQIVMGLAGKPGINNLEVYKRYLHAAKVPNPELILGSPNPKDYNQTDPNAAKIQATAIAKHADIQVKSRGQDLKEKEFAAKLAKIEAEITELQSRAIKNVSDANATHQGITTDQYNSQLETIKAKLQAATQLHQQAVTHDIANKQIAVQQQGQQQDAVEGQQAHQREMIGLDQNQQSIDQQGEQNDADNQSSSGDVDGASGDQGNA